MTNECQQEKKIIETLNAAFHQFHIGLCILQTDHEDLLNISGDIHLFLLGLESQSMEVQLVFQLKKNNN